jgi:O-methyltransferase involved in polyketide biosynthesis
LRAAAADGSRLAISLSVSGTSAARRRLAFRATVAAVGEPARSVLTAADADALFAATGWQAVTDAGRERARAAGFVVATTNPTG